MKKILCLIEFVLIAFNVFAQEAEYDRIYLRNALYLKDTVVISMYGDTLINTTKAAQMIEDSVSTIVTVPDTMYVLGQDEWVGIGDTIRKIDTANFALNSISDTFYIRGQNEWIGINDTIYRIDTAGNADTALYMLSSNIDVDLADTYILYNNAGTIAISPMLVDVDNVTVINNIDVGDTIKVNSISGESSQLKIFSDATINITNNQFSTLQGQLQISNDGTNLTANDNNQLLLSGADNVVIDGDNTSSDDLWLFDETYIYRTNNILTKEDTVAYLSDIIDPVGSSLDTEILYNNSGSVDGAFMTFDGTDISVTFDLNVNSDIMVDDVLYVDSIKNLTGSEIGIGAELQAPSLSIGGSASVDSIVSLKYAVESEAFDKITFNPTSQTHAEGKIFYDTNEYSISAYNDVANFKEELGRGINVRYYNNTGSTINDGDLLRSVGSKVNGAITFIADFAGVASLDSMQGVAMATTITLDGQFGMATLIGQVNGLNTSMYNDNDLLWAGYNGTFQDTSPSPPNYSFIIGRVVYADADSGAIYMFPTGDVAYTPKPTFTASFEDSTETITNPGIDTYELITSATNSLFEEKRNIGFTFQGDSISPNQDGNYTIFFSYSFQGTVAQTDLYRIGTFVDGIKGYSTSRTASGSNNGGVPYPYSAFLTAGQWISFRVANKSDGNRDCIFTDGTVTINFSE